VQKNEYRRILKRGIQELGIKYREELFEILWIYKEFLLLENTKYNLTAITEPREIAVKHFLDSLSLLKFREILPGERVIDIGSGAGFPGLVLKLYQPEMELVLVDSLFKRVSFLNKLINKLEIKNIKTIHCRAEDLGKDEKYRESFNWALSRAVAPVNILAEYTLPLCKKGGMTVFYKGPDYLKELKEADTAISLLGGRVEKSAKIKLPDSGEERNLIFIYKDRATPCKYPRRAGVPKKRPL